MTLRRTIHATLLASALAVGVASLPSTAQAAPAVTSVAIGRDLLAGSASNALSAWISYATTGSSKALKDFRSLRDAVAAEAATRLGIAPATMQAAWRRADVSHQVVLVAAFTQLGTPYRHNASKPGVGFDCSGLTTWAWAQSGVALPRQSGAQIKKVAAVTAATAQAGDLVYYPGHVMLYLGVDNAILHAPYTGRNVEVDFVSKHHVKHLKFGNPLG
jgi:cell wall-associated NlpC family hydrolase